MIRGLLVLSLFIVTPCLAQPQDWQSQLPPPPQQPALTPEYLSELFHTYDQDHNEILSKQQLFAAIDAEVSASPQMLQHMQAQIEDMVGRYDLGGDGLDLREFMDMAEKENQGGEGGEGEYLQQQYVQQQQQQYQQPTQDWWGEEEESYGEQL